MNQTIDILMNRRSLRSFADQPIADDQRIAILDAAIRAPTAGNMMNYAIIDVQDQAKKEVLVRTCDNQPMIAKAPMVLVFLADMQRFYDYLDHCKVHQVCEREALPFETPGEGDFLLACNDAIVAAQNAVVAAESLGLGSCYIGDIMENIEEHRELLGLPPWTFPITMLIIGYPPEQDRRKLSPRLEREFLVHTDTYRRFSAEDFDRMYADFIHRVFPDGRYLRTAENMGQHMYVKKLSSAFMKEMRRSCARGLREWNLGEIL